MNDLVKLKGNDIFTDSLVIAQGTGNQHHAVRELIKKYKDDIEDFGTLLISNEESTGGRPTELFLMNEEQATFLMTLLKNSKKVVAFKKELVRQFYEMRRLLLERQSPHWQATRLESKTNRRMETDEIKALVEYAKANGSKNADKYYVNFTKLANKVVGIPPDSRDAITASQLNNLILIEHIIGEIIKAGIRQGSYYKDIYQACKKQLEQFTAVAFLKAG